MSDLIERQAAINEIARWAGYLDDDMITRVQIGLKRLPSAHPERKRGEWIINSDGYYPYCSKCRNEPKSGNMTDFCPNCGADMRGEAE